MKKAFSLVEIITILFIISLGLLGVLSLIIQNIQSQVYNKNSLIAYQLAQEGIELIRSVRDTNFKMGVNFAMNLDTGTYYMDYQDALPQLYTGNPAQFDLKQDEYGFYVHGTGQDSGFSRRLVIQKIGNYIRLIVYIDWEERGRDMSYEVETFMYNWYGN